MGPTVVIVDDQPTFRAAAKALLEADGFRVVGEAGDGVAGLAAARALAPDVVLLDVRLPDLSGTEVAGLLREDEPRPVVVLTSTADYAYAIEACGARAFIAKAHLSGSALRAALDPP